MAENLWLSFAFLTASIYATLSLLDKVILDSKVSTPFVTSALNVLPKYAVFVLVGWVTGNTLLQSGVPGAGSVTLMATGACIGAVNLYEKMTYYKGLKETSVSRFIPLLSTETVFVLFLAAIFLGQLFTLPMYFGVFAIFVGSVLISLEDLSIKFDMTSRQALVFGLLAAFCASLMTLLLEFLSPRLNPYTILFWYGAGGILSVAVLGGWKALCNTLRPEIETVSLLSASSISLMIGGTVKSIAYFTFLQALESGPAAIVTAIANLDMLLVFFGTIVLTKFTPEVLQEPIDRVTIIQKSTAATLMLAGTVVIQLFV
jgi:drug/metabolite transporter (DMT)-like permease